MPSSFFQQHAGLLHIQDRESGNLILANFCWYRPSLFLALILASILLVIGVFYYGSAAGWSWALKLKLDFIKQLDWQVASQLNKYLANTNAYTQAFWALLNHPWESWLNFVLMLLVNIWLAFGQKNYAIFKKSQLDYQILGRQLLYWLWFQLALLLVNLVFYKFLAINRPSPSLVLAADPVTAADWYWLTVPWLTAKIKLSSSRSMPSGHALVAVYWLSFSWQFARNHGQKLILLVLASLFTWARVVSGAHWLTDIVLAALLGQFWFQLTWFWPKLSR